MPPPQRIQRRLGSSACVRGAKHCQNPIWLRALAVNWVNSIRSRVSLLASTMFAIPVLPPSPFMPPSCHVQNTCVSHSFASAMISRLLSAGHRYSGRVHNDKVGYGHGRGRLDSPQAWSSNSYGKGYSGDSWMELDAGSVKVCVCTHTGMCNMLRRVK